METVSRFQLQKRAWLADAVTKSGRKQAELAAVMGMAPAQLSALINGHKSITDDTMDKAADAMNLELPDLGVRVALPTPAAPPGPGSEDFEMMKRELGDIKNFVATMAPLVANLVQKANKE